MVEHATDRVIAVTSRSTLEGVLDQLRDGSGGSVVIALDPLSVLFSTPDHFRALDAVRAARPLTVTFAVDDAHRTGLALAFGYRVQPSLGATTPRPRVPVSAPPIASANGTYALENAFEDDTHAFDEPEEPEYRVARPRRIAARLWRRTAIATALALGIALLSALLVWQVHTATVTLVPAEQSFSRVVPFAVSVAPTDDPNALQTTLFEAQIAAEGDAVATGKTTVPDASATGGVTFRSRADGATTIKAGTALKGPRDVSYVLLGDVVVPGLDFGRGQLGEAAGKVRASQPGPVGNLGAGYTVRYTENLTYIMGEIVGGTEKQAPVVTDDDIASVRTRLERDLRLRALNEVNAALPSGTTALNDYLTLRTPNMTAQPAAGSQADGAHVRVTLTAQVPVYQNAAFDALIDRRLTEAVKEASGEGDGQRALIPESIVKSKPVFVDVQAPLVRYFATVSGRTRSILSDADLRQLQHSLVGNDQTAAERTLATASRIGQATITYGPSWLPKPLRARMPRTASHIHIKSTEY